MYRHTGIALDTLRIGIVGVIVAAAWHTATGTISSTKTAKATHL